MIIAAYNVNAKNLGTTTIGAVVTASVITNVIVRGANISGVTFEPTVDVGWSSSYNQVLSQVAPVVAQGDSHNMGNFDMLGATVPAFTTLSVKVTQAAEADDYLFDIIVIGTGL